MEQEDRHQQPEVVAPPGRQPRLSERATVVSPGADTTENSVIGQQQWMAIHERRRGGQSVSAIARDMDLDRKTVRSALRRSVWQPYARQESPGMLAAHMAWLVERTTRLVLLAKMPDATAESALAAFTAKLNQITQPLRQSLTYDQGREMARHRELARNTNIKVYFCDPHSPWQRGSCENTNGLLRQMLPKGTDLSIHDQEALDSMADLLNNRPRETLDWRTPIQVFKELMQVAAEKTGATIH